MLYSRLISALGTEGNSPDGKTDALSLSQSTEMPSLAHGWVSRVGFGGAAISGEGGGYGFGDISEREAIDLLSAVLDEGINLFDTAPVYGFGLSESRIGKAFARKRDRVFLVSKGGVSWQENRRIFHSNKRDLLSRMLDQSLSRLQTDYLDLYLIHWPDAQVPITETLEFLHNSQQSGKIRAYGFSNYSITGLHEILALSPIHAIQHEYNVFKRASFREIGKFAISHNLGVMGYGTFNKGILTGHVTLEREKLQQFSKTDLRSWAPWWKREDRTYQYAFVKDLELLLKESGYGLLDFALGFSLAEPSISTALCGMRSISQLREITAALDHLPSPCLVKELLIRLEHLLPSE